jgi:hypothetical protein
MRSIQSGAASRARVPLGPVPYAGFRSVEWKGRTYWFRPHERPWVRCLFLAAFLGCPIPAEEVPSSLRDTDAWGELIVEDDARRVRLAARPGYTLPDC